MKKALITFSILGILIACGQAEDKSAETGTNTQTSADGQSAAEEPVAESAPTTPDLSNNPDYVKGLELEAKNDCGTCHKLDERLVGPSFREIAAKYSMDDATIDSLAMKVINGGAGNWGQVPMTAHPNMPKEDAKAIVKYILLLKK